GRRRASRRGEERPSSSIKPPRGSPRRESKPAEMMIRAGGNLAHRALSQRERGYREIMYVIFAIRARSIRLPVTESRCSLYTTKISLSGRWMMLNRTFELHCLLSLLYWMSAFKNIVVVNP